MKRLKIAVIFLALTVFSICLYAFLLGNKVFDDRFENEYIAWYMLAKGIFCAMALYLLYRIVEVLTRKR